MPCGSSAARLTSILRHGARAVRAVRASTEAERLKLVGLSGLLTRADYCLAMPKRTLILLLAAPLLAGAVTFAQSPAAASALALGPCAARPRGLRLRDTACPAGPQRPDPGHDLAELERRLAGPTPSQRRRRRARGRARAGGAAARRIHRQAIAPALARATCWSSTSAARGESDPLSCPALEQLQHGPREHGASNAARLQIGPARGGFTTQETVHDIEALRQAGGYEKLVLYGTSYGTKVALEYAERYPQHVEALRARLGRARPTGRNRSAIPTFQAIAPVARRAVLAAALRGDHSRIRSATSRAWSRGCASHALQRLRLRRLGRRTHAKLGRGRPARHPGGRRPEPRAARAAARGGAARRCAATPTRCCACRPALGGADPERAQRPRPPGELGDASRRSPVRRRPPARRRPSRGSAPPPAHPARRSPRLPARPAGVRLLPVRRRPPRSTRASSSACAGWPDASPPPPAAGAAAERARR